MESKIVSDKTKLFIASNSECHEIKVSPDSDEVLKVWIKEPTWLQVEQALSSVMNIDSVTQSMDIDLNKMYRFMVKNFIDRTEPSLSATELLRLTPYIGNQMKEILPNPFLDIIEEGDFVLCAVSGKEIPLKELHYWNVELQESYYSPLEVNERYKNLVKKELSTWKDV